MLPLRAGVLCFETEFINMRETTPADLFPTSLIIVNGALTCTQSRTKYCVWSGQTWPSPVLHCGLWLWHGPSDSFIQKWKLRKWLVVRTTERWICEAMMDLQAGLDCTDWDVFRTATNNVLHQVLWDSCIPSHTRVTYNNNKLWFTAELRQLRLDKK